MKKLRKVPKEYTYGEFYSSEHVIRSQKNLKLALAILAVAFLAFTISMAVVLFLYRNIFE